jgi:AcrR family transcriptional regulator
MAQVLKEEVRNRILEAAEKLFFYEGYKGATMGLIAEEADVATGNIYKYFSNKDELFRTVITEEFINELYMLTEKRVKTLSAEIMNDVSIKSLEKNRDANNLLRFWVRNRVKTVILLDMAEGSIYESVRNSYFNMMINESIKGNKILIENKMMLFTFKNRLADTIRGLLDILTQFEKEKDIKTAFTMSWAYHYAGIRGLLESVGS